MGTKVTGRLRPGAALRNLRVAQGEKPGGGRTTVSLHPGRNSYDNNCVGLTYYKIDRGGSMPIVISVVDTWVLAKEIFNDNSDLISHK